MLEIREERFSEYMRTASTMSVKKLPGNLTKTFQLKRRFRHTIAAIFS